MAGKSTQSGIGINVFLGLVAVGLAVLIARDPFHQVTIPFDPAKDLIAPSLGVDPKTGLSESTVKIETTKGPIEIAFFASEAPKNVSRFIQLVKLGFYDGLEFFRAEPGFMIQTGDPKNNGTGGTGYRIAAEFIRRPHKLGTVSMARLPEDPHSADSQFFITLDQFPHLNRNYSVIGEVTKGIEVIKKIEVGDRILSARF